MQINVSYIYIEDLFKISFYTISDFEQEAGFPVQDGRFLDLSVRGLCTDERGKVHDIDKLLMIGINIKKNFKSSIKLF